MLQYWGAGGRYATLNIELFFFCGWGRMHGATKMCIHDVCPLIGSGDDLPPPPRSLRIPPSGEILVE